MAGRILRWEKRPARRFGPLRFPLTEPTAAVEGHLTAPAKGRTPASLKASAKACQLILVRRATKVPSTDSIHPTGCPHAPIPCQSPSRHHAVCRPRGRRNAGPAVYSGWAVLDGVAGWKSARAAATCGGDFSSFLVGTHTNDPGSIPAVSTGTQKQLSQSFGRSPSPCDSC